MPYGAQVKKLDTVSLEGKVEIAVLPEVMRELGLQAGQKVDKDTAEKIVAENDRRERFL